MTFHICPATTADVPAIAQVAGLCSTADTHTHLKAIAKGYGPSSEDTARYHSNGMEAGIETTIADPKRDLIVAKSDSGEIIGSVAWATRGYNTESKINDGESLRPEKPLHDAIESRPKTVIASFELPPPPPASPTLLRTVPNLEIVTNAAMKHYIQQLMPPDTVCRYIVGINVLPAYQKMGVGAALVNWGLDRARSEGVFCWVSSGMDGIRFFEKLGFVEVGRLEVDLDEWAEGIKKPVDDNSEQTASREEQLWGKYVWNWMRWTP